MELYRRRARGALPFVFTFIRNADQKAAHASKAAQGCRVNAERGRAAVRCVSVKNNMYYMGVVVRRRIHHAPRLLTHQSL